MYRTRLTTVLVVLAVVVVSVGTAAAAYAVTPGPQTPNAANETANATQNDTALAPGTQLAAVVGVQGAELDEEVAARGFSVRANRSSTHAARATVVSEQTASLQERLTALERQRTELTDAYQNGTIGTGEYHARLAILDARTRALQRLANQTADVAAELPDDVAAEHGVNRTILDDLRDRASELSGPEVSAIARNVTGDLPESARGDHGSADASSDQKPTKGRDNADASKQSADGETTLTTTVDVTATTTTVEGNVTGDGTTESP